MRQLPQARAVLNRILRTAYRDAPEIPDPAFGAMPEYRGGRLYCQQHSTPSKFAEYHRGEAPSPAAEHLPAERV